MFQLQRINVAAKTPIACPAVMLDHPGAPTTREMTGKRRKGSTSARRGRIVKPANRSSTGFMAGRILLLDGVTIR
jgi:hypothetical protein